MVRGEHIRMSKNKKHKKNAPISLSKVNKKRRFSMSAPLPRKGFTLNKLERRNQIIIISAIIIAIVLGVVIATRPNAYEVSVGDTVLGIVKGEETTQQSLEVVAAGLREKYKADVRVVTQTDIKPVYATKRKLVTPDYLISQIKQNVEYEIEMVELVIDDESKGIFGSEQEAENLIKKIKDKYIPEQVTEVKEAKLVADVKFQPIYAKEEQLSDPIHVYETLTKTKEEGKVYTIVSGDNLWTIAKKNSMSVEELMQINPDITEETLLQIGQQLNIKVDKPAVSVQVIEEYQKTEEFQPEPIVTEDPDQYVTYRKKVSSGKKGKREITLNNIYVDGLLQETITKETKVIEEGESERIIVGTKKLPPKAATGKFRRPASGNLTSGFGYRWGTMHNGIDIANSYGTSIYASDGGVVTCAGWQGGYGNLVIIDHGNGFKTYYGHASKVLVKTGQKVGKGEKIALMGSTGNSTGSHVHFEIRKNGTPQNPFNYI